MFASVVVIIVGASLLAIVLLLFVTVLKTVSSKREFVKRSASLPFLDKFSIWAGHLNSLSFADGLVYRISAAHRRLNAKTIGMMLGYRWGALSCDLDLIKRVVVDNQETDRFAMSIPVKEFEYDSSLMSKGDQWRRIRRAVAPALKSNMFKTPNVQRELTSSVNKLINAIECKLEQDDGVTELDMSDYAHRFSIDLNFNAFYKQDNKVDFSAKVDRLTTIVESGQEALMWNPIVRISAIFPILRPFFDWLILNFHSQGVWRREIMNFIKQQTKLNFQARKHLEKCRQSGQKTIVDEDNFSLQNGTKFSRNMIDHVIDQFYGGKLTRSEYFHSTFFLFAAADRTTAESIAHAIYRLATHQDVQEKLRESILEMGEESEYLSWVISESLRLLPAVPAGCSRMASRDYKCEGGVLPAGTILITCAYTIHRLEEYWGQDAEEFRPERFAQAKSFHPLQYIPFGAGARHCPGKELAQHEMKRLLCALLTRYKFHCEPTEFRYNSPWLIFTIPDKHVRVRISRAE